MDNKMKDQYTKPVEGYFILEQLDKDGNVIDRYEDKNQIMLYSKRVMRNSIAGGLVPTTSPGITNNIHINTFILGTEGHLDNLLVPKNFDYTRDQLFSDENNSKLYPITFRADGSIINEGYDSALPNSAGDDSLITINYLTETNNEAVEYQIIIPTANANDTTQAIAYTEAGLYTNLNQDIPDLDVSNDIIVPNYGDLFAMRTFPAKIKDTATSLSITWRIIF
jgi:hypothetical protein